ncbi:uncharacterized protein PHACADRAFT_214429 [Phanerochaete carnosa HHB-10118-sp]|uniref:Uncharacterized protein n=1 Tax=Phanerochaete carnosa (strain HHB-10118-sp) TaxID=650164 RepID=K5VE01_PHACS|nr:uncharacterized protein PHACADRAFT_214429 [Phanerochaete carnosa HHB-10118-sp]EKM49333.1 hypothetical protein PHACADRAFT_214429 [Phanerochaete carnosa HHB-10118-sp]
MTGKDLTTSGSHLSRTSDSGYGGGDAAISALHCSTLLRCYNHRHGDVGNIDSPYPKVEQQSINFLYTLNQDTHHLSGTRTFPDRTALGQASARTQSLQGKPPNQHLFLPAPLTVPSVTHSQYARPDGAARLAGRLHRVRLKGCAAEEGTAGRRPASVDTLRRLKTVKVGQAATAQSMNHTLAMGGGVIVVSGLR